MAGSLANSYGRNTGDRYHDGENYGGGDDDAAEDDDGDEAQNCRMVMGPSGSGYRATDQNSASLRVQCIRSPMLSCACSSISTRSTALIFTKFRVWSTEFPIFGYGTLVVSHSSLSVPMSIETARESQ